jgi:predicted RNA-binding Zn-ribbon protein involved in translation (DUF1610 family)
MTTEQIESGEITAWDPDPKEAAEDERIAAEERALIAVQPTRSADHHIVTGMATLARMSQSEFEATMASIKTGQERMRQFQREAMTKGEDYGTVKGIDRPFLHLPGAEKLCLLYGLAVRQEAERLTGDGVIAPPLAYHVKSYVHLGSFDGPIVAMGYGEANSWETKYRYSWQKATCPTCGREGLIKGRKEGKLAGKYWCPGKEGGCNSTFEPAATKADGSLLIPPPAKVENPDPHSLAETLIQMAAKRSLVAGTRRATGTSGLFTQDEDSPSVQQQSGGATDDDDTEPEIKKVEAGNIAAGGKTELASRQQLDRLVALSKEKDLGHGGIARLLLRLFKVEVEEAPLAVSAAARALTADQMAQLIETVETGGLPEEALQHKAEDLHEDLHE